MSSRDTSETFEEVMSSGDRIETYLRKHGLLNDPLIIGRDDPHRNIYPHINLAAVDTRYTVSRVHAELVKIGNDWLLADKASVNGTFLNGQKLKPNLPRKLRPNDVCKFGDLKFKFTGRKLKQV